jgi:N-acylneuraminate cytidylyltransferase
MKRIAIIPARGGSKRIPNKNIRPFAGRPIIAYSIEAALSSGLFDEVMVSTNDERIADIALSYGAKVPFLRSEVNSNDFASTVDVLLEVLEWYAQQGIFFKEGCCIYATAPFVTTQMLNSAFDLFDNSDFDVIYPIVPYSHPIQRALKIDENGKLEMLSPDYKSSRTQDISKNYHDTGLFYCFRTDALLAEKTILGKNSGGFIISQLDCHDIDNPIDWELAEMKYDRLNSESFKGRSI